MATIVPVRQMRRAVTFYTRKLGGKVLYRGTGEMKDSFAGLRVAGEEFWLVAAPTREKRTLAYQAFLVKDIRRAVKELQKKGVIFQKAERMGPKSRIEGVIAVESFGASAFFKDSEGNLLMVWQNYAEM